MNDKLTALIIGASRGIGREFVHQLLTNNYTVFATARDDESLADLQNAGAYAARTDVTIPESLSQLSWQLNGVQLDLVVYVAGVSHTFNGATKLPTTEVFNNTMQVNVLGAMQSLPLFAPLIKPTTGRFVFITSAMGSITEADSSVCWTYRASKAARNMVVHSARCDYPNITLATIHPGWVRTNLGGPGGKMSATESVSAMLNVIDKLSLSDSGSFLSYDGQTIPW